MIPTPGAILLHLRRRYGHGLRTAYWRDVVRPRILRTPALHGTTDASVCEIHVMTSATDWLDLIWALKSFYRASKRRYALCIHDDGTLGPECVAALRAQFPDARLIERPRADQEVLASLEPYPRCLEFRRTNHLSPKVFDFAHYLAAPRMMLLDSDVLFFNAPHELLCRIEDPEYRLNTVNGDVAGVYTVSRDVVRRQMGFELIDRFNSGLGLIHRGSMRLDWIETFLGMPGIIGHFWRVEQTLFALCSSRFGTELLPPEYDVRLGQGDARAPCRHYVGAIRHLLYREGLPRLARAGTLSRGDVSRNGSTP